MTFQIWAEVWRQSLVRSWGALPTSGGMGFLHWAGWVTRTRSLIQLHKAFDYGRFQTLAVSSKSQRRCLCAICACGLANTTQSTQPRTVTTFRIASSPTQSVKVSGFWNSKRASHCQYVDFRVVSLSQEETLPGGGRHSCHSSFSLPPAPAPLPGKLLAVCAFASAGRFLSVWPFVSGSVTKQPVSRFSRGLVWVPVSFLFVVE